MPRASWLAVVLLGALGCHGSTQAGAPPARRPGFQLPELVAGELLRSGVCDELHVRAWRIEARCGGALVRLEQTPAELRYSCPGLAADPCRLLVEQLLGAPVPDDMTTGLGDPQGDVVEAAPGGVWAKDVPEGTTHMIEPDDLAGADYYTFRGRLVPPGAMVRILDVSPHDPGLAAQRKQILGRECEVLQLVEHDGWFAGKLTCGELTLEPLKIQVALAGELVRIDAIDEDDAFYGDRQALVGRQCVRGPVRDIQGEWLSADLYCDGAYLSFTRVKLTALGRI